MRFFSILKWSFNAAYDGYFPYLDWTGKPYPTDGSCPEGLLAGQPLCGEYFMVLWGLKGDLEYFDNTLGLEGPGDANACVCCRANNRDAERPWTDHREGAAWEATEFTDATWRPTHPNPCELFNIIGVTVLSIIVDLMHTKHIGVDQYFHASVLALLCYHVMPGTPTQNLAEIWEILYDHWQDTLYCACTPPPAHPTSTLVLPCLLSSIP